MKKSKTKLFFLCFVSGVIFLSVGVYLSLRTVDFQKNGITTQAEIVLIEKNQDEKGKEEITVYVKYIVENTEYIGCLDYYSDLLSEGNMVTILYLPDNPQKIIYSKFNTLPQILFFVGAAVCIGFSIVCFVAICRNKKKEN